MTAMHRSAPLLLATVLALAACSSDKPKAAPEGAGDAAPAAASASSASSGGSSSGDADLADVTNYHLTMAKVDQWYAAQRNVALKVKAMSPAERAAYESTNASDPNASLADIAATFDRIPPVRDAVREAGLSTKEFATLTMSLMQSGMAAAVLKMRPKDNQDSLAREMKANMDNIRFMQAHEAELTKRQQDMQAEMQRLGMDKGE
jgi:hypothetical protein